MPRRLLISLVGIIIVVGLGLGVWYWFSALSLPVTAPVPAVNQPSTTEPPAGTTESTVPATPAPNAGLIFAALTFAERFGSYSTDALNENVAAVSSLTTSGFQQQLEQTVKAQASPAEGVFYGVSTRALSAEVQSQTGSTASLKVKTQRQERFNRTGEVRLSYQDLLVRLERSGNTWLVVGADWAK